MKLYDIFVYGTLRQSGMYSHYLATSELVVEEYQLPGYALYDYQQWYPYMIPQSGATVTGDIYRISEAALPDLHELEGIDEQLYRFAYLENHGIHTYLKFNNDVSGLKFVKGGDWLLYLRSLTSKT